MEHSVCQLAFSSRSRPAHSCIRVYVCSKYIVDYIYVYISIYIINYLYIYIYTHTYIHTCIQKKRLLGLRFCATHYFHYTYIYTWSLLPRIHYADRVGENYFAVSSPEHRWSRPRLPQESQLAVACVVGSGLWAHYGLCLGSRVTVTPCMVRRLAFPAPPGASWTIDHGGGGEGGGAAERVTIHWHLACFPGSEQVCAMLPQPQPEALSHNPTIRAHLTQKPPLP